MAKLTQNGVTERHQVQNQEFQTKTKPNPLLAIRVLQHHPSLPDNYSIAMTQPIKLIGVVLSWFAVYINFS